MTKRAKLTNPVVEAFKGGGVYTSGKQAGQPKEYDILWDTGCPGLGVRYSRTIGARTYFYQRRAKGSYRARTITFGQHGERVVARSIVTTAQAGEVVLNASSARDLAESLKALMKARVDPVLERQKAEQAAQQQAELTEEQRLIDRAHSIKLREVMELYFQKHRTRKRQPLRPSTQEDIRGCFDRNLSDWLDEPIVKITRKRCLERFDEITDRGAPSQANLTFAYLRAMCFFARDEFEDENEDGEFLILGVNPVSRMLKRRKMNPETERKTRVPLDKIGAVFAMLRQRALEKRNKTAADWASLMILTGLRRGESRSMMWPQLDFDARLITIPGSVTKNHRELVLPMSDLLHDILKSRKPAHAAGYVFPSRTRKGQHIVDSEEIKNAISKVAEKRVTLHDLRRTFVDICNAAGVDADQRRQLLNHKGDIHLRHYGSTHPLQAAVNATAAWVLAQAQATRKAPTPSHSEEQEALAA